MQLYEVGSEMLIVLVVFDYQEKTEHRWEAESLKMLSNDPFRPLTLVLKRRGLLTERF